ncbi:MAG: tRNA preQ1(34) S-adenosylmethionine ribosyltransferase-isomerase QueA [Chloroflexota bacterium]
MKTSDFDYPLPPDRIAQTPLEPRDSSRLLVLRRDTGEVEHRLFRDLGLPAPAKYPRSTRRVKGEWGLLRPGDLLVLNRTRVIPARLYARKPTGGKVELLLLRRRDPLTWEALVGGKGLRVGKRVKVGTGLTPVQEPVQEPVHEPAQEGPEAEILEILDGPGRLIRFSEPIEPYFPKVGHVPLPPYIHEKLDDPERYQTVYAHEPGSAAAPTAGLHFTPRLLEALQAGGVKTAYVTLHVGLDTFAPVTEQDPRKHKIHTEWCELPQETADAVNETRQSGGRVIAVGTTSVRVLESAPHIHNPQLRSPRRGQIAHRKSQIGNRKSQIASFSASTSLFILPGYDFKVVDAMITNFHLPRSTLLMLVSAFAGRERILAAYEVAVREGYRFYSFGDAMFIL